MKKFLSILIPTRNRSRYLSYSIQSALNINSRDIEILVSENHSTDNSSEILSQFSDPRLQVFKPEKPLAMHENWEFILSKAQGEWVYFLGDDDAMMPHAVEHLRKVVSRHPRVEAIVSPRAYYFWDGSHADFGGHQISCTFSDKEVWRDSKKMLSKCLDGAVEYLNLPQIYSGGFQRCSLINRVKRAQGGLYFKSVTPDAYSALVAVLHTFRYLEIGVPLAWVGTSPSLQSKTKSDANIVGLKDRDKDFKGMHSDETLRLNFALGEFNSYTFTLCFYEAFTSAVPHVGYALVSQDHLKKIYYDFCYKKGSTGDVNASIYLAKEIGFCTPTALTYDYHVFRFKRKMFSLVDKFKRIYPVALEKLGFVERNAYRSPADTKFETILAFDSFLSKMYLRYTKKQE